jgi:predicted dehydrogenase
MAIKVGICGTGAFAASFIPLFKAHPEVSQVTLCDLDDAKLRQSSDRFGISATCQSLDELCQTDVDAIAIFTQNTLHGPQAVQALRAGKHVYSAVPSAISMDEISALVKAVEESGKIYQIGETSYYYPCAIYCRERFRKGDFGQVVYGEAEYYHDMDHGLYDVGKWRFGQDWLKYTGSPPMYYPTHSTSMIVSVTGAHATHVSCMGYVDRHDDGVYNPENNVWGNPFSNETAMCRMSDGSIMRINEFRRVACSGERVSLYGTEGSYEEQSNANAWVTKFGAPEDLRELLACADIPAEQITGPMSKVTDNTTHRGASKVHPLHLLPREFVGLPNGHNGSHQFLVHDFVTACINGEQPPNDVYQAARYLVPGLIAHESAKQGGVLLEVPDFGSGK